MLLDKKQLLYYTENINKYVFWGATMQYEHER